MAYLDRERQIQHSAQRKDEQRGYRGDIGDPSTEEDASIHSTENHTSSEQEYTDWSERRSDRREFDDRNEGQNQQGTPSWSSRRDYPRNNSPRNSPSRDNANTNWNSSGDERLRREEQNFRSPRDTATTRSLHGGSDYSPNGPHAGKGPKGYRRSDANLHDDVCRMLEMDADLDASEIEVHCSDGLVTLTGEVCDREAKKRAEVCAEQVYGVRDVMNQLQVCNRAQRRP